jgi:hypothetical protein
MRFINKRIYKLMIGISCGFLLTKLSNLPLYYFPFFSICTIMLLEIVVTVKHLVMLEVSIWEVFEDLLQA